MLGDSAAAAAASMGGWVTADLCLIHTVVMDMHACILALSERSDSDRAMSVSDANTTSSEGSASTTDGPQSQSQSQDMARKGFEGDGRDEAGAVVVVVVVIVMVVLLVVLVVGIVVVLRVVG